MIDTKTLLGKQYDVLGHGLCGGVTEIRTFHDAKVYFSTSKEEFIEQALPLLNRDCYVGINPRKDTSKPGTYDCVSHLSCVVVDLDQKVNDFADAIEVMSKIMYHYPGGLPVNSGVGLHIYYPVSPIKINDWQPISEQLKKWGSYLKAKYETPKTKVDSIFDLPRVIRVWGSVNTKSGVICEPQTANDSWKRLSFPFKQEETKVETTNETIIQGERNNALFKYAVSLVKQNYKQEDVIASVKVKNSKDCRPPLAEREVDTIIQSAIRYQEIPKEVDSRVKKADQSYFNSLKNRKMGILTGITPLDEMISGLKQQKLYIIAARPTSGKTTILTQILSNICEQGKTCVFFPTEVGSEPIYDKIVSRRTGVSLRKFQNGTFTEDDLRAIESCKPYLESLKLTVIEDFSVTVDKIEYALKKYDPDFVAIDFIQAFAFNDPESVAEKSEVVRRLKELAVNYNKPIILASQLNRGDGKRNLKNLKGTGALEEFGDVICFLETVDRLHYPRKVDLDVMKSKYSETGVIPMLFWSGTCKFEVDSLASNGR